jgi:hypothetical protein
MTLNSVAGGPGGIEIVFPKFVSYNSTTKHLYVDKIPVEADYITTNPSPYTFPSSGTLYVITDQAGIGSNNLAVVSATYTGINGALNRFQGLGASGPSSYQDANGGNLSEAQFEAAISAGDKISGMQFLPVNIGGEQGLPDSRTVGYDDALAPYGFRDITVYNNDLGTNINPGAPTKVVPGPVPAGSFGIEDKQRQGPHTFVSDPTAPMYLDIPGRLDADNLTATDWLNLHGVTNVRRYAEARLPGIAPPRISMGSSRQRVEPSSGSLMIL